MTQYFVEDDILQCLRHSSVYAYFSCLACLAGDFSTPNGYVKFIPKMFYKINVWRRLNHRFEILKIVTLVKHETARKSTLVAFRFIVNI